MTTPARSAPSRTADRLAGFGQTIFAEMSRLAVEHDAINLGQGFPDFDGPDFIKDAAAKAMRDGHNQYARLLGAAPLNRAIAERFNTDSGVGIEPDRHVTVTSGCTEAIAASMLGLVNPGYEVILFEPYYDSYRACVSMAGATPKFVTLNAPDWSFDAAAFRAAFTDRTRAVLLNTPHNPTGKVFTRDELALIAECCIERDVIALTDEVYEHLVYDGEHVRLAALPGMFDRTVTMSSLGKTFSLTGWKIGWSIAPDDLTAAVRAAHQFLVFAVAHPLQHGAAAALGAEVSYYDELRETFRERRDLLIDGLSSIGFTVHPASAGYFVMADHTAFGFDDDVAFAKHLIEQTGVVGIPPSAFYHDPGPARSMTRFAFCKKRETLEAALERLARLNRAQG